MVSSGPQNLKIRSTGLQSQNFSNLVNIQSLGKYLGSLIRRIEHQLAGPFLLFQDTETFRLVQKEFFKPTAS